MLAQGLTVVAIVFAGVQEFGSDKLFRTTRSSGVTTDGSSTPTISPGEKAAFEKRMKEAEDAHYAETTGSSGMPRPEVSNYPVTERSAQPPNTSPSSSSWLKFWK